MEVHIVYHFIDRLRRIFNHIYKIFKPREYEKWKFEFANKMKNYEREMKDCESNYDINFEDVISVKNQLTS